MTIDNEILIFETKYWEAMKKNDVEAAISLTRFPCTISGPQGSRQVSEEQYRQIMKGMDGSKFKESKIENPKVELLNSDTAVIVYESTVNGMKMLDTSLWIKEGEDWSCGYHSEFPRAA